MNGMSEVDRMSEENERNEMNGMSGTNKMNTVNKKALIICLQYDNSNIGSYNDLLLIYNSLKGRNYEICVITDRKNIVSSNIVNIRIKWLHQSDIMYFHFSGHSRIINGETNLLLNNSETLAIDSIFLDIKDSSTLIASFDCCNSSNFSLRWRYSDHDRQMISNSCKYNIRKNIIFIGSSLSDSKNITYQGKDYGVLSLAIYILLQNKNNKITIFSLNEGLSKIFNDLIVTQKYLFMLLKNIIYMII